MVPTDLSNVLRAHVETLARSDGRAVGTDGHKRSRKYICEQLESLKLTPYSGKSFEIPYGQPTGRFSNIVATAPGLSRSSSPLLVGAHYDTCGMLPGADDNAAAVAIALELCRVFSTSNPVRDIVFAFFDAEEPPHFIAPSMGSIRFYEDQMDERKVHAALVLDLVGHDVPVPGLETVMFVTGMESSSQWSDILRATEPADAISWAPVLNSYVGSMSDHHIFEQHGHSYLFFSCGRWIHYHQSTDTPEKLNYKKMATFTTVLADLIAKSSRAEIPADRADSTSSELHFLNKNLGPTLAKMGLSGTFTQRRDIDLVVSTLLSRFSV
ncbi:MAG: M28 family peptidase [Candidatus Obscuribacterales bacterium]|nr:M28 family peptidase [Candidatus Obscuribacterales bacterium]